MNIANPLPAKLPVKIHPTKSSTATDYATLGICASQPTQPKPTEARRPRILLAKRLPEDYFGQDSVYVAPGAKTVPITLIRPNQNFGPLKSSTGTLIEHTVLGDVDDFEEFDKLYSKSLPNLDEKADIIKNQELPITKHAEVNNENQKNDEKVSSNVEQTDERKEWLQKLHIFQKYREMREENALSNWKRHSIEWSRIEERIGKSIKKPADELLMARLGEYREFVEERDLIEEALMLLEEHNVNFWKTGLRLGSDLLGLCFQMPSGGPRQQERLRTYELYNAKKTKKPSEYQEYRKKELEQVISHLDPFSKHDDGGYLEVVGRGTQDNSNVELTKEYMERLDRRASCKSMQTLGTQPTTRAVTPKLYTHSDKECSDIEGLVHGMQLMFSTKRMYFSVLLDQVATSVLTIHNCGTVAIHFTWVLMRHKNPLQVSAIYDNAQRFYMNYPSGVILPGTAYDFPIIFKSNTPGLFTELWTLETHPAMSHQQDLTITLQGLAIEKNNYQQKCLDIEHAQTVATKVIDKILSNINKGLKPKPYALDPNHTSFELRNKDMKANICLLFMAHQIRFQQHIYDQLVLLANSTFHILGKQITWDNSLVNLYEFMLEINQADIRSQHIEKLNSLVHEATLVTTTPRHSMLSALCYDMLIDIACKVSDNSDQLRSQMGLPLAVR
ncbi:hypothetical protein BATDEDRAFT_87286 [Batrachochytrium dendrobatidis JAM81]|uniref:Uncharacterized protein n=1 Tax=Batrachochytrium dendrobatidis (strain JAM81 / FGSC 10211) TaxID=684364 RepID=F4NXN1_BATDJ|nr:uncharacterized protein BATDEDRAFT_87286 [Batrachochytrium dendrobatidis JAM81]EGF81875.1 hypothetical protein BATDEDRAFT_87286 [Batrachochytrium dendrobatidis JAM81]|eukprot:XP_006677560.1 hypothetical protein BATDEDRAFT_87286 [Batrachochytrium dendrobatidis JAM81]